MIKEYEYLHGVVFTRICSVTDLEISIKPYSNQGYSSFVLNNSAGLYLKYSGKRMTPWGFTLTRSHLLEIEDLYDKFGEVFISLICYLDGVAVINYTELKQLIPEAEDTRWISVSRHKNKMYTVSSLNGQLDLKVSKTSCPNKIVSFLASK